jgi:hypothetical protein
MRALPNFDPRQPPLRWLLRLPIALYRLGLGWLLGAGALSFSQWAAEERDAIHALSHRLDEAIRTKGVGEFNGDEFGAGRCTLVIIRPRCRHAIQRSRVASARLAANSGWLRDQAVRRRPRSQCPGGQGPAYLV